MYVVLHFVASSAFQGKNAVYLDAVDLSFAKEIKLAVSDFPSDKLLQPVFARGNARVLRGRGDGLPVLQFSDVVFSDKPFPA